jgi:CheY-like chemotaxis protein
VGRELPDLILLDIQLPGEDGLAITNKIRTDSRTALLIIVAVTAHGMLGDHRQCHPSEHVFGWQDLPSPTCSRDLLPQGWRRGPGSALRAARITAA